MKIGNKLTAFGTVVLLTATMGMAQTKKEPAAAAPAKAATAAKPAAATTHVMNNATVQSISGSGAAMTVVLQGTKSTDKPVTLMLNSSTTKTGDLVQGAKVTAHYRVDNGQNIATSISVAAAKPAAKAAASAAAPSTKTKAK